VEERQKSSAGTTWPHKAAWTVFIAILFWASMNIPRFSGQVPENGVVSHPRLFPYYFQSNIDAPLELSTSIGFPGYYKIQPNRVNRPVVYGFIAGLRGWVADPLVSLFAGKAAGRQSWGMWTARDYLLTYSIWMAVNLAFLLICAAAYHRLVRSHFDSFTASLSVMLMLSSPIVLLSLREVHLGVYHLLVGVACLVFWHAVLLGVGEGVRKGVGKGVGEGVSGPGWKDGADRRPFTRAELILASLGIGVLFLGKPCINGFALGFALCVLMGQARKLAWILPCVALPTVAWVFAARALGYVYGVTEVKDFRAGVWILDVGSVSNLLHEMTAFLALWFKCMGENVSLAHLPFAALGLIALWKKGPRRFLAVAALAALADLGFYFFVHRVNANYGMSTLLFFFVLVAEGIRSTTGWTARFRGMIQMPTPIPALIAIVLLLAIQFALNARQLPHYGG
jgi:hypothetical protein